MKNLFILGLGLGVALLAACRPDDVVVCSPSPETLASLRAASPAPQRFVLTLGQTQTIRTAGGATLTFPANTFRLPNGTLATGVAEVRVREIYSVADMVLANMPTSTVGLADAQPLISGGEFNIQVWQGAARLRLGPGGVATFPATPAPTLTLTSPVPAAGLDTTRMRLWQQPAPPQSITRDSSGWRALLGPNGRFVEVPASAGYYSVAVPLDSIGWWNLDQFWHAYQAQPRATVAVGVPYSPQTTRVYFRPVGYNGLARCWQLLNGNPWNCELPLGASVVAVVLQERDGLLYFGTQRATVAAGLVLTPPLEALPAAEIVRRIRLL